MGVGSEDLAEFSRLAMLVLVSGVLYVKRTEG